jgi:hypothetical protein
MSAVNHQFRLAARLAETFASASRSLSGWAREAREVQRRTGRATPEAAIQDRPDERGEAPESGHRL